MDVFTMGEALVCFRPIDGPAASAATYERSFGGAEFNTAVGLARLGSTVTWFSRISGDPLSDALIAILDREGVDHSWTVRDARAPIGLMIKDVAIGDEVHVRYYRAGSSAARISPEDLPVDAVLGATTMHVSGVAMWISPSSRATVERAIGLRAARGLPVSFDPNLRDQLIDRDDAVAAVRALLPSVTHLLCNAAEATALTGEPDALHAALALAESGPSAVVVKRGAHGALAVESGRVVERHAERVARFVDPVGAGDAFNAGWIHARLRGEDAAGALDLGARVSAGVVAHRGDYEGFPRLVPEPPARLPLATSAKGASA